MSGGMNNKSAVSRGAFWRTAKAVFWSFLGIRKSSAFQEDTAKLNPFHIMVVGLVGGIVFVASLIALVNWIVAK